MTAKLVKARPKAVEYLPDWAQCCDEVTEHFEADRKAEQTYILDMGDSRVRTGNVCRFCETPWPEHRVYRDVVDRKFAPIDCLDLDEGPTA